MPATPKQGSTLDNLSNEVASIFNQAQMSGLNHSKNCVALHKVHDAATKVYHKRRSGAYRLVGEKKFHHAFSIQLMGVMECRKGHAPADLVGRFVGQYTKFVNEKAHEEHLLLVENGEEDEEQGTYGNRFTTAVSKQLLSGLCAKEKGVRYRCMHILSEMARNLGEIDVALYKTLRTAFTERLKDKEPSVRALAATCLGVLCKDEIADALEDDEVNAEDALLEMLSMDEKAEVRKAALSNIQLKPTTLPRVITRCRDTDANVRKLVYIQLRKGIFKAKASDEDEDEPGPTHPSRLSIDHLETIVNGIRDRETGVRAAAMAVVNEWVKCFEKAALKLEPDVDETYRIESGVVSLLEVFEVTDCDAEELDIVEHMLKAIFASRKDVYDGLEFDGNYWRVLGSENALLSRVFADYCKEKKDVEKMNSVFPVLSDMALHIESHYEAFTNLSDQAVRDELKIRQFILGELLKFAAVLDYTDQFGYKKMLPMITNMLLENALPISLLPLCINVLRSLAATEKEFVRIVVGIIQELRESGQEQVRAEDGSVLDGGQDVMDEIDTRCLIMSKHMLSEIQSTFAENSTLKGLESLVFPCASRHDNAVIQINAIMCAGLYALLHEERAPLILQLCLKEIESNCSEAEAEPGVLIAHYQTVFDLLTDYGNAVIEIRDPSWKSKDYIHDFLIEQIGEQYDSSVLVVICQGLTKMILTKQLSEAATLVALINLFKALICPDTQGSQSLIQCLSNFFHEYVMSSPKHTVAMRKIFPDVFKSVAEDRADLKEDNNEDDLISASNLCKKFVEWTDPDLLKNTEPKRMKHVDRKTHLILAHDVLKELLKSTTFEKEEKKALFLMLPSLYLPNADELGSGELMAVNVKLLIDSLRKCRPPKDALSKKALDKFEKSINDKYKTQLEGISEDEFRKWDELHELFEFLDDLIPDDDDSVLDIPDKRSRKRRSTTTTSDNELDTPGKGRPRYKKPRCSNSSDEGESRLLKGRTRGVSTKEETVEPTLPRKAARPGHLKISAPEYITISSDSDEELRPVSKPRARYRQTSSARVKYEEKEEDVDAELSALLRSPGISSVDVTQDSLFSTSGSEDEDEEDEVSGILRPQ